MPQAIRGIKVCVTLGHQLATMHYTEPEPQADDQVEGLVDGKGYCEAHMRRHEEEDRRRDPTR